MTQAWALTLYLGSILLNMGAFFSMSGMITNLHPKDASLRCMTPITEDAYRQCAAADQESTSRRPYLTLLPRTKMCSKWVLLPSCSMILQVSACTVWISLFT